MAAKLRSSDAFLSWKIHENKNGLSASAMPQTRTVAQTFQMDLEGKLLRKRRREPISKRWKRRGKNSRRETGEREK